MTRINNNITVTHTQLIGMIGIDAIVRVLSVNRNHEARSRLWACRDDAITDRRVAKFLSCETSEPMGYVET